MSVSPFDHPILSALLGDEEVADFFSWDRELAALLRFETALAIAEAAEGVIPDDAASAISECCATFAPNMTALRDGTARDGVVMPELVRQLSQSIGPKHGNHVHHGATSQDAIDSGLMVRLSSVVGILLHRLVSVSDSLTRLDDSFGERSLMGRTRMQAAIPIKVRDRISSWREPLLRHRLRMVESKKELLVVQFGGATGTLDKLGPRGSAVRQRLAKELGLGDAPQWHSQRDRLVVFANNLSLITSSLGKLGQDIALLAQDGDEISFSRGGTSSAMPHKQNPVRAEVLVSLANFNATLVSAMYRTLAHEQERSGSAWTLEWMVLPQMAVAAAAALEHAKSVVAEMRELGQVEN